jgi:hypothetical protein
VRYGRRFKAHAIRTCTTIVALATNVLQTSAQLAPPLQNIGSVLKCLSKRNKRYLDPLVSTPPTSRMSGELHTVCPCVQLPSFALVPASILREHQLYNMKKKLPYPSRPIQRMRHHTVWPCL